MVMQWSHVRARTLHSGAMSTRKDDSKGFIARIAEVAATSNFVVKAQHSLYHQFERTGLQIGPIIHGPPVRVLGMEKEMHLLANSIRNNGSNCLYVYDHLSGTYGARQGATWHQRGLRDVLGASRVKRNEVVTIAGLGLIPERDVCETLEEHLLEACTSTNLQQVDLALVEVDDSTFEFGSDTFEASVRTLEALVAAGNLQGYAVFLNARPFTLHTPSDAAAEKEGIMMLPLMVEQALSSVHSNCELVAYAVSPTIQTPATYPMLEPMFDQGETVGSWGPDGPIEGEDEDDDEDDADPTWLSRMAVDAFLGRRGGGEGEGPAYPLVDASGASEQIAAALDDLCPQLSDTPRLQDKVLRIVLSVGIDCVVVDAELAPLLQRPQILPEQLLHSDLTDDVFGTFQLPAEFFE